MYDKLDGDDRRQALRAINDTEFEKKQFEQIEAATASLNGYGDL